VRIGLNVRMASSKEKDTYVGKNIEKKADKSPLILDVFGLSNFNPILPIITAIIAYTRPIPTLDRFFSITYPLYVCVANRFRFDRNAPGFSKCAIRVPLLREGRGPWFGKYIKTMGIIGMLCPLLVQIVAPTSIAEAAAPHLYLALCQGVMESMSSGPKFYASPQLMIPIGFNAYRLGSLKTWVWTAWQSFRDARLHMNGGKVMIWETAGLVLAFANAVIWTYHLFVFLLLRVLPQYLDQNKFPNANVSWKACQMVPVLDK